ncbi:OmpA family protein [Bombella sp. ESL0385]|nr:OmpA family protein [Bombella sp. ESL0385]
MINRLAFLPILLCALLLLGRGFPMAWAQVSTNMDALPSAAVSSSHHAPVGHKQRKVAHAQNTTSSQPPAKAKATPAPTPAGYSRKLDIPAKAPTPTVITPPPFPVALHPPVPAATVVPAATSHSHTEPLQGGALRVLFDPNSADLNEETIEAVRHYAQSMAPKTEVRFILHSYANVPGNDISMPRRLALSRALAIRGLLVQNGIATTRIYPIAQGRPTADDTAPTERLDIRPESNPPPVETPLSADQPSNEKTPKP